MKKSKPSSPVATAISAPSALMLTPQCLLLPEFGKIGVPVIRLGGGMTSIHPVAKIDTIRLIYALLEGTVGAISASKGEARFAAPLAP